MVENTKKKLAAVMFSKFVEFERYLAEDESFAVKILSDHDKYIDENNKFKNGDKVKIIECRPHSKTKKFEVLGDNKWYRYKPSYL